MQLTVDNPWRAARWSAVAGLLLVPLVAMQLTTEVHWTVGDFVVAGILLGGVALAYEAVLVAGWTARTRAGAAVGLIAGLAIVWAELAVGVFT